MLGSQSALMLVEEWVEVPVDGIRHYEVSRRGEVRNSRTGRILKGYDKVKNGKRTGRLLVSLGGRKYTVAHLVLLSWRGPRPDGMEVDHINGNPGDDRLSNLRYCTPADNLANAWRTGRVRVGVKLDEVAVSRIKVMLAWGISMEWIGRLYGVTGACISYIRDGKAWADVLPAEGALQRSQGPPGP
jgi:hypothetical protein